MLSPPHPHGYTLETAKQTVHILPHPHTSRDVAQTQNSGICWCLAALTMHRRVGDNIEQSWTSCVEHEL